MKTRILVVDDIQENRYLLRALLEGYGYEVFEATNGLRALECGRAEPPDAVVTDLLMPEMDGFTFCREWLRDESLRHIPIVVYTATYTDPKDRQLALDAGACDFIIKPAEPEALVRAVLQALGKAEPPTPGGPKLQSTDFYERYANRLKEKLNRKIRQLAAREQQLTDYVTRSEAILDASRDAIIAIDGDLRVRAWNFSAERMFGYCESEVVGRPFDAFIPADRVDEAKEMLADVRERKEITRYETQRLRKDGSLVDVTISLSFLGPEIGFVGVASDLSALRAAADEKKKLEDQLAIAQRMESVGRLAGGVAHDFNNLLTIVLSHAAIIESDLDADSPLREDATRIREAGERAAALTAQLLAFSRRKAIKPEVLDLNDAVRSMERILERVIGDDIDLRASLAPDLGRIEADRSQIEQVILNLAVNARDAMPAGGRLAIETKNAVIGPAEADKRAPLPPGRYVTMSVTDSGVGMDERTRALAFDPFFTTKEPGKGTGLGLATVYGIVQHVKGSVWIDSRPGQGTTVEIYLPSVDRPLSVRVMPATRQDGRGQGETVLVVEDQDVVRNLAQRILERSGYRVVVAGSGPEALRVAQNAEQPIDLLLTDVSMPGIDGRELAQRILGLRPSVRVLFISGDRDSAIAPDGVLAGSVSLLDKPFTVDDLTTTVRAVLDGRAPGGIGE